MFFIELVVILYFLYISSYVLFFGIGGLFYKKKTTQDSMPFSYLILVPGYKEDAVIFETVQKNLQINYPNDDFDLCVIADSFEEDTLKKLSSLNCNVIEVSFEKSTKVKSIKKALQTIENSYDYIVILDADNVIEADYLNKVNSYVSSTACKALQTQRAPKNSNNKLAVLDGISEAINNHIYRKGASNLNFSASLNGSGMVFDFDLFKNVIMQMDSVGGFDRELEYRLLERGVQVKYLEEAVVFDEKIDDHSNFKNQRKRWISSQYVYLRRYFLKGVKGLLRGDIVYFNSTVWRNIQLPRLINIGLITGVTFLFLFFRDSLSIPYWFWFLIWCVHTVAIAISIPRSFYNKELFKAILMLPKLFVSMFLLMFKLKGANKKFIHTQHKAA